MYNRPVIKQNDLEIISFLTKLDLSDLKNSEFSSALNNILELISDVTESELEDSITPTYQVTGIDLSLREDEVVEFSNIQLIIDNFTNSHDRYLKVDKVL